jgi:hypothetical protein
MDHASRVQVRGLHLQFHGGVAGLALEKPQAECLHDGIPGQQSSAGSGGAGRQYHRIVSQGGRR